MAWVCSIKIFFHLLYIMYIRAGWLCRQRWAKLECEKEACCIIYVQILIRQELYKLEVCGIILEWRRVSFQFRKVVVLSGVESTAYFRNVIRHLATQSELSITSNMQFTQIHTSQPSTLSPDSLPHSPPLLLPFTTFLDVSGIRILITWNWRKRSCGDMSGGAHEGEHIYDAI